MLYFKFSTKSLHTQKRLTYFEVKYETETTKNTTDLKCEHLFL